MASKRHFSPSEIAAEMRQIADHIEETYPASASDLREGAVSLVEQLETLEERLDIALGALHDITGMNVNDQRNTPFQFEQRIHKAAHDAWMAARGKALFPASESGQP